MKNETKKSDEAGNLHKPPVMGSADYWMNADKSTVEKYLKENVDDMKEYKRKKQEILKRCYVVIKTNKQKTD